MEFKVAKLDRTATIVSIVTTAFLTILSIFFVVKVPLGRLFAIFMMFIPLCCYLLSPKKFIFKGSTLIIEKVVGRQIIIPMSDIEAYIRVPNFAKLKVARIYGNPDK